MHRLSFKDWFYNEMANYGFDQNANSQILGGTDTMDGDGVFEICDSAKVMDELFHMPPIGNMPATQFFENAVQWGNEVGAIQANVMPLGSQRMVVSRLVPNARGENTWICKYIYAFKDNKDQYKEHEIADRVYKEVQNIAKQPIEAGDTEFDEMERLSWKLWHTTRKLHPSYIMFPTRFQKMEENYFKLVFEYRGQGAGSPMGGFTGKAEQFNIDMVYYPKTGIIRSFAYEIDSNPAGPKWQLQTSEWDMNFSPKQDEDEIIKNIVMTFMQY